MVHVPVTQVTIVIRIPKFYTQRRALLLQKPWQAAVKAFAKDLEGRGRTDLPIHLLPLLPGQLQGSFNGGSQCGPSLLWGRIKVTAQIILIHASDDRAVIIKQQHLFPVICLH